MLKCHFHRAIIPTPYGMDQFLDIVSQSSYARRIDTFLNIKKQHQIEDLIADYLRAEDLMC
jgi:hypothetical protein